MFILKSNSKLKNNVTEQYMHDAREYQKIIKMDIIKKPLIIVPVELFIFIFFQI